MARCPLRGGPEHSRPGAGRAAAREGAGRSPEQERSMPQITERIEQIYLQVVRRNPGEAEFHQAVKEVGNTLGMVLRKYPQYAEHRIIERICEPERQIIFRVPWQDDRGEVQINRGFRVEFNS